MKKALFSLLPCVFISAQSYSLTEKSTPWSENFRWAIDSSLRSSVNLDNRDDEVRAFLGLDLHKIVSKDNKDIGTFVIQPFLQKLYHVDQGRSNFDEGDDWDLTWRMTYFNYTGFQNSNALNIKVGHIEIPFGLEFNEDTNQTLRQFSFNERGLKADWGFSLNGYLNNYDYELLFSRGSGNDYHEEGNPFLLSGRIGKQVNAISRYGLSYYYGDIKPNSTRYKQVGLDGSYNLHNWTFSAELAGGEENDENVSYSLIETAWQNSTTIHKFYWQLRHNIEQIDNDNRASSNSIIGYDWSPISNFFVNSQVRINRHTTRQIDDHTDVILQLRYRFQ